MPDLATDISDEQLMNAIAMGDREALEQLYDRHAGVVYGLARRMLKDPGTCEELVQDVFLTVWQRASTFDEERARVLTWLVATTRNRAIDQLRRERVRPQRHGSELAELTVADERSDSNPVTVASEHERAGRIRGALAKLPAAQRHAIELAYFSGLSQSEIAERMHEPIGTIKSRMFHGMRRLRELLDDSGVRDA